MTHQPLDGIGRVGVPERVEGVRDVADDWPVHQDVEIPERHRARCTEVFVADIAPAEDGGFVIGDQCLVVHAAVDAGELERRSDRLEPAARDRVEEPYLDVGVGAYREQDLVVGVCAQVIDQQAHSDSPVRRPEYGRPKCAPRQVTMPDVVLEVERLVCHFGEYDTGQERIDPVGQQVERAFARMRLLIRGIALAKTRRFCVLLRIGRRAARLRRQARTRDQQDSDNRRAKISKPSHIGFPLRWAGSGCGRVSPTSGPVSLDSLAAALFPQTRAGVARSSQVVARMAWTAETAPVGKDRRCLRDGTS